MGVMRTLGSSMASDRMSHPLAGAQNHGGSNGPTQQFPYGRGRAYHTPIPPDLVHSPPEDDESNSFAMSFVFVGKYYYTASNF